jgi:hypothetical protein
MMSGPEWFMMAMVVAMAYLAIAPLYVLAMHAFMPQRLLETYWTATHFRPGELALFTGTLLAPMRTLMLMGVIAFPRLGRKRDLMQAYRLSPRWYRMAAQLFFGWSLASGVGVVGILAGLNI